MRNAFLSISALVIATQAGAQDNPWRWSLSAGPTIMRWKYSDYAVCVTLCDSFSMQPGGHVVTSAAHARFNAAVGASRRWVGTSLTTRWELQYNRSTSPLHQRDPYFFDTTGTGYTAPNYWYQHAPLDQTLSATMTLQWEALPGRAVTPYLITSGGFAMNRLRWNSDSTSSRLDSKHDSFGPMVAVGAGMRAKFFKHEIFAEWRSYHTFNLTGAAITPLSIGFRY